MVRPRNSAAPDHGFAGYDGVIAYVSKSRPGSNFGTARRPAMADALQAEGLHIVSNFPVRQTRRLDAVRLTRGSEGVAIAQTALNFAMAGAGGPAPIILHRRDI